MYLEIKDFEWNETANEVVVIVPTKGYDLKKADILIESDYVKINVKPFLFECFLKYEIIVDSSRVVVSNGYFQLHLTKAEKGLTWSELQKLNLDKSTKSAIKQGAIERFSKRCIDEESKKDKIKQENSSFTLKEMMKLDEDERKRIDTIKTEERTNMMNEVEKWRQEKEVVNHQQMQLIEEARKEYVKKANKIRSCPTADDNNIFDNSSNRPNSNQVKKEPIRAPIREKNTITISFTPREFPTPERESVKEKEDEWLRQQRERRQLKLSDNGDNGDDLARKQSDPVWLREKGDTFFKAGDYEGAMAAYSYAIDLKCHLHTLFSNRAACHIKLRNFFKAIEDATQALNLLNPPVPQNQKARVLAHLRRGAAYCQLLMYKEGLLDYEAAFKLDPSNEVIQKDIEKIKFQCEEEQRLL